MTFQHPDLGPRIGVGRTAEVFALGDDRAVKLFYSGFDQREAQNEIEFTKLATAWDLPTARFQETIEIDGRTGIVLDRIHGESLLKRITRKPNELKDLVREFARLHCRLHSIEVSAKPSFRDYLSKQIRSASGLGSALKDQVISYMDRIPATNSVLCHGDYHPENVLVSNRRLVVMDWATARSGCAAADCARTALLLRVGSTAHLDPLTRVIASLSRGVFLRMYARQYSNQAAPQNTRTEQWMPVMAAARLAEGIEDERARLLGIVYARFET